MSRDDNFYKNFNSNSSNFASFKNSFIIPFISGLLGTTLVIGIAFGVPNVRKKLFNFDNTNNTILTDSNNLNDNIPVPISLSNYSDTAIYAANKVLPSIVGVKVEYTITSNFIQGMSQLLQAEGSGIIISSDGYILTNNHIINSSDSSIFYEVSKAAKVYVYLYNDETPYEAKIIGTDGETDLAVIKIEKGDLTPAEIGDSNSLKIGEFTMAIGNPLGMESSVTSGIISALNRSVTTDDGTTYTLIQTDATINPGNSGGALINAEGKVIGLNTLKLSGSGIEGMGFAIPINDTISIYKQLIENGKVLRPYIGIGGINLDKLNAQHYNLPVGIYIKEIQANSPAASSNLQIGDIITALDGTKVETMKDLNKIKNTKKIGDTITLDIYRNNKTQQIKVTLGEKP